MDINTVNAIKNRDDFLMFLEEHVITKENHIRLNEYLEAVKSWVEDMDGFYINTGQKQPEKIDWSFIATLFYVGTIYE